MTKPDRPVARTFVPRRYLARARRKDLPRRGMPERLSTQQTPPESDSEHPRQTPRSERRQTPDTP